MSQKRPRNIVLNWHRNGTKHLKNGFPAHPEFIYRLSGEWQGWNDFLGTPKGTPEYRENATLDAIESEAYVLFQKQRS